MYKGSGTSNNSWCEIRVFLVTSWLNKMVKLTLGNFILVRKSKDWVWCTQEKICTVWLYLWNPDWLWLISSLIKRWLHSAKVTGDLLWNDANQERNIQWSALERNCEDYPCKLWCTKKKVNVKSLKLDFFYVHIVLSCFFVPRLGKMWSSNGLIDALQILQPSCNKEKRTQYARYRPYDEEHTHVCLGFVAFCKGLSSGH